MVFLVLLVVARMVVWGMQTEGILRNEHYSHQDLIGFFGYQLRMKIRTDRMRLVLVDFSKMRVSVTSLVCVNRANLDFLF